MQPHKTIFDDCPVLSLTILVDCSQPVADAENSEQHLKSAHLQDHSALVVFPDVVDKVKVGTEEPN